MILRWDVVGGSLGWCSLGSELRGTLLGLRIIAMNDSEFMNEYCVVRADEVTHYKRHGQLRGHFLGVWVESWTARGGRR